MSSDDKWSFEDWACGTGISDTCKNEKMNWDEPRAWQALVDTMIPILETPIVFGAQYLANEVGLEQGTVKALNAVRCMLNSGVAGQWQMGAGVWLLLKYIGIEGDVRAELDTAYSYVCTCIYDVNGLKEMLGMSAESNAEFSSCSEKARMERIKAKEDKKSFEKRQQEEARRSVAEAAENKKIADTIAAIEALDGCELKESSALEKEKCFASVEAFYQRTKQILQFWNTMQWSSGGKDYTTNLVDQNNAKHSAWTLEGTLQAMVKLFPERFNKDGALIQNCTVGDSRIWGETNCGQIISSWVLSVEGARPCLGEEKCNEEKVCYVGNDTAAGKVGGSLCDLVELQYGYSQWQEKASITCTDSTLLKTGAGLDGCVKVADEWKYRKEYVNPYQPNFTTVGQKIGIEPKITEKEVEKEVEEDVLDEAGVPTGEKKTVTKKETETTKEIVAIGGVKEEHISCLAADYITIKQGSENCWAYWLRGDALEIGTKADGSPYKEDHYVWLTREDISCGQDDEGKDLIGPEECEIIKRVDCNVSKLQRLVPDPTGVMVCLPTFQWRARAKE